MKYILLHGLGQTAASWDRTIEAMGRRPEILSPDYLTGWPVSLSAMRIYIMHLSGIAGNSMSRCIYAACHWVESSLCSMESSIAGASRPWC